MNVCGYIESNGVKYWKPNMAALEGDWGREIFEEIKNSPKPDWDKLQREADEVANRIAEARRNGTF